MRTGDGLFDGGTETGIDGVKVELLDNLFTELNNDLTSMGGVYAFTVDDELATYVIRETQPTGVANGAASWATRTATASRARLRTAPSIRRTRWC